MTLLEKNKRRLFYDKNDVIVRDSVKADVLPMAKNLRQADIDEIWASHHLLPLEAMMKSYDSSLTCLSACINEEPFAMFGCTPENFISSKGLIWMLATNRIAEVKSEFYKYSRFFVDILLEDYPLLYNYVDARNTRSIIWLKRIGAEIKEAKPHGMDGLPFHYFSFTRR